MPPAEQAGMVMNIFQRLEVSAAAVSNHWNSHRLLLQTVGRGNRRGAMMRSCRTTAIHPVVLPAGHIPEHLEPASSPALKLDRRPSRRPQTAQEDRAAAQHRAAIVRERRPAE
jgi:hypothetical protein